ncbi:MAG: hypothetical protein J2P24_21330 [Streptosporangiales bacterium]|nr:hypothetical protein [Streptosporangiales bacterium]
MAYATVDDVAVRLGRPLTDDERAMVAALLGDVEALIKARIPDLDAQVTAGTIARDVVVMVEANAVLRVLRNPGGYRSESDGDYSYTVDANAAAGYLTITPDEWALLGAGGDAFTITPYVRPAGWVPDPWRPYGREVPSP